MIMQIGSINLMLLQSLKDSSKYGLEIVKYVSDATNGAMDLKQPSLYSGLNRLEKRGLISSYWQDSEIGGRRHYYTITELGLTQLKLHAAEIESIMSGNIPVSTDNDDVQPTASTEDNTTVTSNGITDDIEDTNTTTSDDTQEDTEDNEDTQYLDATSTPADNILTDFDTSAEQDSAPIDIQQLLQPDTETIPTTATIQPDHNTSESAHTPETPPTPPTDNDLAQYREYKPSPQRHGHKSFSQKMRSYVEPKNNYSQFEMPKTTEIVDTPTPPPPPTPPYSQEDHTPTSNNNIHSYQPRDTFFTTQSQETPIEYTKQESNNTIDYKNILGELDAELNYTNSNTASIHHSPDITSSSSNIPLDIPTSNNIPNNTSKPTEPKKSAYSTTLANILTTAKNVNNTPKPTRNNPTHNLVNNQQRLEELNRKYDGCAELKCNTPPPPVENSINDIPVQKKIDSNKTGYTHIAQDSITIKPYVKQAQGTQTDKHYILINKFNLIRAFIMFIIMCLEIGGMYWYFDSTNIFTPQNTSATAVFIVSTIVVCMYIGLTLAFTVPNLQKIVQRDKISWKSDFFYRILLTVIMITFVIALNVFLGMSTFNDPSFIVQWLVPSILILNITLSGLVGYIMNLNNVQCK